MCEPHHSLNQYSTEEAVAPAVEQAVREIGVPFYAILPAGADPEDDVGQWDSSTSLLRIQMEFGEAAKFLSKDSGFLHLSRFGVGHSESRAARLGRSNWSATDATLYEVQWWNRNVSFDGKYRIPKQAERTILSAKGNASTDVFRRANAILEKEALNAATKYAMKTSIGSVKILRRFLEETIRTSTNLRSRNYEGAFFDLFTASGRDEFQRRLRTAELEDFWSRMSFDNSTTLEQRDRLMKVVCGMTRMRTLMRVEWADEAKLWD